MPFPSTRLRRLRINPRVRRQVQETELSANRFVIPLFVRSGVGKETPIPSMPGVSQRSVDRLIPYVHCLYERGVRSVLLFGIPKAKNLLGSDAYAANGVVQQAVRALKKALPDLLVITDLCFCEYTSHGHCGVVKGTSLDNDATLRLIARTAVVQAKAGADVIAPSGMIDGMVKTIRTALDRAGFENTLILSYAAKYASAFYGPFRDAAESAPLFGDRLTHQMNPANVEEAMREVGHDIEEGADIIMIKPALAYLDIITRVKQKFGVPVAAYNVSGEYAMVQAAAQNGWIDGKRVASEILLSIRRAGADWIITYHVDALP